MNELIGKEVIVHPHLTADPINMQGRTGTIINLIHENDEVFVRFENNNIGLYSTDALLLLKPEHLLLEYLDLAH